METQIIIEQYPIWYLLGCLGLGIAAAALLYYKDRSFADSDTTKRAILPLALLRCLTVAGIAALLLSPLINGVLIVTTEITRDRLDNKLAVCRLALRYSPSPAIIGKCSALLALAGNTTEAGTLWRMGLRAFPAEMAQIRLMLAETAKGEPAIGHVLDASATTR